MRELFYPRSVAVIGASRNKGKVGYAILENLKLNFKGKVYPVNPNAREILGLKCYSSVLDIEDDVDLAVICVRADLVPGIVEECGKKGVKVAVVISAGFSEVGNRELEERLIEAARKYGVRVVGPNCIGVVNNENGLSTLFSDPEKFKMPENGNIAFVSHSGALGLAVMDKFAEMQVGVNKFASIGNRVDIDESDLLEYFSRDKRVGVVAMYIEGVRNGRKFFNALKKCSKRKPVVVLKAGKTEQGKRAAFSHTASLAGSYEVYRGVFKQANAVEARDLEELMDYVKVFSYYKKVSGRRVAIVTNGGGFGIIATDEAVNEGLELACFEKKSVDKLKKLLPEHCVVSNPLDLTGDADAYRYELALRVLEKDKNVDVICVICLLQLATVGREIVHVLTRGYKKPIVACVGGSAYSIKIVKELQKRGIPVYPTPHRAIKAIRALCEYSEG